MPLFDSATKARLTELQSLDDAIAFRLARMGSPCPDCAPGQQCEDHAQDTQLVADYQARHGSVMTELLSPLDPGEVDRAMRRGDGLPPTVLAASLLLKARLRELAADGPVVAWLDGRLVALEVDGDRMVERPLTTDDSD